MAIDHRIIQQIGVKDNAPALNIFQNALASSQNRKLQNQQAAQQAELQPFRQQLLEQQVQAGEASASTAGREEELISAHQIGQRVKPLLAAGNIEGVREFLTRDGGQDALEMLERLDSGDTTDLLSDIDQVATLVSQQQGRGLTAGQRDRRAIRKDLEGAINPSTGKLKPPGELTALQRMAAIEAGLLSGAGKTTETERITSDPLKSEKVIDFESSKAGEIKTAQEQAVIDAASRKSEELKLGQRRGEIATNINKAAITARRDRPKVAAVRKALNAVNTGKFAQAKALLGQFIPGLDISNEEVIQQQITQFVLDTLNKQTGTKTDFDFKKASEASASFGKTTKGNKAILDILIKNLDRSIDESKQFKRFKKTGGDSLNFEFVTGESDDPGSPASNDFGGFKILSVE